MDFATISEALAATWLSGDGALACNSRPFILSVKGMMLPLMHSSVPICLGSWAYG